ncbi:hypothetical protein LG047_15390 [Methylocystis sp. WRRC1]|uniref:hypothetical protein n=1 Tax=Methylocystis sp. WRRC1 TaxID=1732014 RepID=UPI001D140DA2|nr:hypothetical protein [Methylocystis sp. WRRC1]MCC3246684.1 hypothetical protein [Methylocystis sp. WRRC1]
MEIQIEDAAPKAPAKPAAEKPAAKPRLIKMKRNPETFAAPHEAEVHISEVENYIRGGWVVA